MLIGAYHKPKKCPNAIEQLHSCEDFQTKKGTSFWTLITIVLSCLSNPMNRGVYRKNFNKTRSGKEHKEALEKELQIYL